MHYLHLWEAEAEAEAEASFIVSALSLSRDRWFQLNFMKMPIP